MHDELVNLHPNPNSFPGPDRGRMQRQCETNIIVRIPVPGLTNNRDQNVDLFIRFAP